MTKDEAWGLASKLWDAIKWQVVENEQWEELTRQERFWVIRVDSLDVVKNAIYEDVLARILAEEPAFTDNKIDILQVLDRHDIKWYKEAMKGATR